MRTKYGSVDFQAKAFNKTKCSVEIKRIRKEKEGWVGRQRNKG